MKFYAGEEFKLTESWIAKVKKKKKKIRENEESDI